MAGAVARHRDPPAVRLDELPRDVQPDAEALRARRRGAGSIEAVEQARWLLRLDAHALVPDRDGRVAVLALDLHADLAAVRRVFDGVREQVVQDLLQPLR